MNESRLQPTEGFSYRYDPLTDPDQKELASTSIGVIGIRQLAPGEMSAPETLDETDAFCFVKKGKVRVLGADGSVTSEGEQGDNIVILAGTTYRLEAVSDEAAELLQFYASNDALPESFKPFS